MNFEKPLRSIENYVLKNFVYLFDIFLKDHKNLTRLKYWR